MTKRIFSGLLAVTFLLITFTSCEEQTEESAPDLPPYESLAIDFDSFTSTTKSTADMQGDTTMINFFAASVTVTFWNAILAGTMVVPVAAFYQSFNHEATFVGDKTWQWTYDITGFAASYTARLTGTVGSDAIIWEMYISKAGVSSFDEFKWFEGTSALDGTNGQWILYHSYDIQEAVLQIDWEKSGDEIGDIRYTYIRESDNGDVNQLSEDSYIEYGLSDSDMDAYYDIHYTTRDIEDAGFLDVNIEWSTSEYYGHIKAEHYYQDTAWHCWDSSGYDTVCD